VERIKSAITGITGVCTASMRAAWRSVWIMMRLFHRAA
jgi:hypothetical protein